MAINSVPRLVAVSIGAIALAAALGAQAISSVSTRKMPALAVSTFPANGLAREALAFQMFSVAAADKEDPASAARDNAGQALRAIQSDPLAPKAYAVLAQASEDQSVRGDILEAASVVNRRDLNLQTLLLQKHVAAGDYTRTIDTLDQILRVHPEYSPEFFPVLADALTLEQTIPRFVEILDGSSPWHLKFLTYAVRQNAAIPNLAVLRPQISSADESFDRRLIISLAAQGDIESAAALYRTVADAAETSLPDGMLDWNTAYPPFDWRFVDQAGFRSQPSRDGEELELFVRPGKGGLVAGRLLSAPAAPFAIRIDRDIKPAHQREDANVRLTCTNNPQPVLERTFDTDTTVFQVPSLPADCQYVVLAINARAWTGRSALRGTIERIAIVPAGTAATAPSTSTP